MPFGNIFHMSFGTFFICQLKAFFTFLWETFIAVICKEGTCHHSHFPIHKNDLKSSDRCTKWRPPHQIWNMETWDDTIIFAIDDDDDDDDDEGNSFIVYKAISKSLKITK